MKTNDGARVNRISAEEEKTGPENNELEVPAGDENSQKKMLQLEDEDVKKNLKSARARGDGNCLLSAVYYSRPKKPDFKSLRLKISEYIDKNPEDFVRLFHSDGPTTSVPNERRSSSQHTRLIQRNGEWLGEHEIVALSHLECVIIKVYQASFDSYIQYQ